MFIDEARISVKAGSGGSGCTSFFRNRNGKAGKPSGGNGGDGGDIIITASRHIQTLLDFYYNKNFRAERGIHGGSNFKTGRRGHDYIINVPCGTVIKDASKGLLLRELLRDNENVIIARGGRGGRGNSKFKAGTPGDEGEEKELILELKLIADVGIIGYPNAGKSSLISKISSAKSKIANYPFTTKRPILGMVERDGDVLYFADMPGLIEGAHEGKGLGHTFLRHIERTSILIHMVDVSKIERPDPYRDLISIEKELELYSKELNRKKKIVVLSKIDLPGAKDNIKMIEKKIGEKAFPVSSLTGEGIDDLLDHVFKISRKGDI